MGGRVRYFDKPELPKQLSTVIQGSTADGFKMAIGELYPQLKQLGARIVLAPHDELLVEAPASKATEVEATTLAGMEIGMRRYVTDVDVVVDPKVGPSWG